MKPIVTEHSNRTFTAPGCYDVPAQNDGQKTVICWELTDEDLEKMKKSRRIYMSIFAGPSMPPVNLSADDLHSRSADHNAMIPYEHTVLKATQPMLLIWNTLDQDAPLTVKIDTGTYRRVNVIKPKIVHVHDFKKGDYFFGTMPGTGRRVLARIDNIVDLPNGERDYEETIFEIE